MLVEYNKAGWHGLGYCDMVHLWHCDNILMIFNHTHTHALVGVIRKRLSFIAANKLFNCNCHCFNAFMWLVIVKIILYLSSISSPYNLHVIQVVSTRWWWWSMISWSCVSAWVKYNNPTLYSYNPVPLWVSPGEVWHWQEVDWISLICSCFVDARQLRAGDRDYERVCNELETWVRL